jgi:hypothetical protein
MSWKKKLHRCWKQLLIAVIFVVIVRLDESRHNEEFIVVEHIFDIDQKFVIMVKYWIFNVCSSLDNKTRKFNEAKKFSLFSSIIDICHIPIILGDDTTGNNISITRGSFDGRTFTRWRIAPIRIFNQQ